jgi:hypothetical protein
VSAQARLVALGLLVLAILAGLWKVYAMGEAAGLQQLTEYKLEQGKQTVKLLEKNAAATADLQTKSDQTRKAKNEEINRLNIDLADALERLHNRPERPGEGGVPVDTGVGAGTRCTGSGLFRDDAKFLEWFAAGTKRLQLDLGECQAALHRAREALK